MKEMFLDMVSDAVIPISGLGIQYYGGPTVTVIASKQTSMFFFKLTFNQVY